MKTPLLLAAIYPCFAAIALHAETVPKDSPELKALRDQYQGDVAAAVKPIQERYIIRLETLLRTCTQRGDLSGALAVQQELQTLKVTKPEEDTATHRATKAAMIGGTWTWETTQAGEAKTIEFNDDGTGNHGGRGNTKWRVTADNEVTITNPAKGTAVIRLAPGLKSFAGTDYDGKPVIGKRFR
jgi:hypothetical protein